MPDDIRINTSIFNNPKIMLLSRKLGDHGVICLIRLWCFSASSKPDGNLSSYSHEMLEAAAGWTGKDRELFDIFCELGFLDCDGDSVLLHDWKEHQGWVANAPKRSESAKKKVLLRWAIDGLPKKEHEKFREWFDSEYQFKVCDNTDSILTAYRQYTNGNTPLLSSPLPSLPEEVKESSPKNDIFYLSKKKRKLSGEKLKRFEKFWCEFNYKSGKAEAADSWIDVYTPDIFTEIISAAKKEASGRGELLKRGRTPKMAQGWLSGRRWEDESNTVNDGWI